MHGQLDPDDDELDEGMFSLEGQSLRRERTLNQCCKFLFIAMACVGVGLVTACAALHDKGCAAEADALQVDTPMRLLHSRICLGMFKSIISPCKL